MVREDSYLGGSVPRCSCRETFERSTLRYCEFQSALPRGAYTALPGGKNDSLEYLRDRGHYLMASSVNDDEKADDNCGRFLFAEQTRSPRCVASVDYFTESRIMSDEGEMKETIQKFGTMWDQ